MRTLSIALFAICLSAFALATGCSAPVKSGCGSDAQCREGRVCVDGKCQSPLNNLNAQNGASNGANGGTNGVNGGTNGDVNGMNGDPNNINGSTNDDPNNVNGDPNADPNNAIDPDVELCEQFCDLLFGSCIDQECMVNDDQRVFLDEAFEACMYEGLEEGEPGCVDGVKAEPGAREEVEEVVAEFTCTSPELVSLRCNDLELGDACGCEPVADIGKACMDDGECPGDDLPTFCAPENGDPPFPGGYCAAFGCELDRRGAAFNEECGEDNVCVPAGGGGGEGLCLDGCSSHDECRPGYQCRLVGFQPLGNMSVDPVRVCLVECSDQIRCRNSAERCNDGRCEFPCDDQGGMGPTGRQRCNALGFTCEPDADGDEWCIMP